MKLFLPILVILILAGCSDTSPATSTDTPNIGYKAVCIDGIQYWKAGSAMSPRIHKHSLNPTPCADS